MFIVLVLLIALNLSVAPAMGSDPINSLPAEKVDKTKESPASGEGFIVEESSPQSGGDGTKVKKLVDDPGQGEEVPQKMVEGAVFMTGLEDLPTKTGVGINVSAWYRPMGEWWVGMTMRGSFIPGEDAYERGLSYRAGGAVRYYFMPHREANRFVMAYLHAEVGYRGLHFSGASSETTSVAGSYFTLGAGVGRALSTKTYLGLFFAYSVAIWGDICVTEGSDEQCTSAGTADFETTSWQFGLYVSTSF